MTDQNQPIPATRVVSIPAGMPTPRWREPRTAEIPNGELPLIPRGAPKDKLPKAIWTAHAKVFDLDDPQQAADYEKVWQNITMGKATLSKEDGPHFNPQTGKWTTFLRWADITYKV